MKRKVIPITTLLWRRKQPKHIHQSSMGVAITHIHGEEMSMILKERCCQFPGCTVTLTHFELQNGVKKSKLTAYGIDKRGQRDMLTIDHKVAQCLGGKDDKDNKWIMCSQHNSLKAKAEGWLNDVINRRKPVEIAL